MVILGLMGVAVAWGQARYAQSRFEKVAKQVEDFLVQHAKDHGGVDTRISLLEQTTKELKGDFDADHRRIRKLQAHTGVTDP